MEKRNEKRRVGIYSIFILPLLCLLVLAIPQSVEAASYRLKLRQIYIHYPRVAAYFDFRDADGNCAKPKGSVSLNIGGKDFKPESIKQFSRKDEGVAIVFAIDVSSSISSKRFAELKNAVSNQVKQMGPKDYAAIVSFGDSAKVIQDYTQEPKVLLYTVQQLKANNDNTALNSGIISALDLAGINNSSLPNRRIVILCSDGMDDSSLSATEYEVRSAIDKIRVPIYSVYFDAAKTDKSSRQKQIEAIGEFARRSGGNLYDVKSLPFSRIFDEISKEVEDANAAIFNIEGVSSEGQLQRVSLTYFDDGLSLSDGMDVRILKPKENKDEEAVSGDASSADVNNGNTASADVNSGDATSADSNSRTGGEDGGTDWLSTISNNFRANKLLFCGAIAGVLLAICGGVFLVIGARKAKRGREGATGEAQMSFSDDRESQTQAFPTAQVSGSTQKITSDVMRGAQTQRVNSVSTGPSIYVELSVTGSRDNSEQYKVSIRDRLTLGRKSGGASDLGISGDATISAKHCELIFSKGHLLIADLGSTNGTYVNGSPIAGTYPLNDGDRLLLGKTELKIKIVGVR